MEDDFGGTEIAAPLRAAQEDPIYFSGKKKRVFILTDGDVWQPEEVQELAKKYCETIRVFTFGLGLDCNKNMVTQVAKAGRGTYTFVKDGSAALKSQVVRALGNAMEPSLKGARCSWNDQEVSIGEVYRNSLVSQTKLCTAAEFQAISFSFKTDQNPGVH